MKPTIGRIVHYMDAQGIAWPAIVTQVEPGVAITVTVFDNSMTTAGVKPTTMASGPREAGIGQWWLPERI